MASKSAKISIRNFSCIEEADVELSKLTILIGPQASGKSVISKLVYFCYDVLSRQFRAAEDQKTLVEFKESLVDEFRKWFPPSAWGGKQFSIVFRSGPIFIKIARQPQKKSGKSNIRINFSPDFDEFYDQHLKEIAAVISKKKRSSSPPDFEVLWRVQGAARRRLEQKLKEHYVSWQLFIPAGRSFFTSVGKALAVFEYGGILDPLTLQFGRYFARIRDNRRNRFFAHGRPGREAQEVRNKMMRDLFGGNITFDREQEYVESEDGRKTPFATLSSGQQELLPLWLALEYVQEGAPDSMTYIEEPEAHLFPAAQSQLIEYLASIVSDSKVDRRMLITTHSPYVLSQINVLLKAGVVAAEKPNERERIAKVVQSGNWLHRGSTTAYAIVGKRVKRIFDSDGLIDGDYLDEVSGYIAREFNSLLEIEVAEGAE